MASLSRLPSGKWRVRWREHPGANEKARHFDRKPDAERFLNELRADLQRGTYIDPSAGRITFEEYAEEWRKRQLHRPSTSHQVESHLRRHVYPTLGTRSLSMVRRSDIQSLVKGLSASGLAPSTVTTIYRHTAAVFKAAVSDRLIPSTPCHDVRLPRRDGQGRIEPLSVEVVHALAEALPGHLQGLVLFAAGTGLRQGECFGLTVDRVDFLGRRVRVDRQIDPAGSDDFAPLKTRASDRSVPLPEVVGTALAAHLAQYPAGRGELIFRTPSGGRLQRNRFSETWKSARQEVGAPEWATFHDLRHFYASLLIRHGESVKVVQARLGHASAAETLDTYSHLWPDSEDTTRAAIDAVLGAVAGAGALGDSRTPMGLREVDQLR